MKAYQGNIDHVKEVWGYESAFGQKGFTNEKAKKPEEEQQDEQNSLEKVVAIFTRNENLTIRVKEVSDIINWCEEYFTTHVLVTSSVFTSTTQTDDPLSTFVKMREETKRFQIQPRS